MRAPQPLHTPDPTYLTAQEAADRLRFPSLHAFYSYRRRHRILPCRTRRLLFLASEVDRVVVVDAKPLPFRKVSA